MQDYLISELLSPLYIPNEKQFWKLVCFRPFVTGWGGTYCLRSLKTAFFSDWFLSN